jgi:ribosomal protein S18 acetylase RimI-like enzyme
MSAEPTSKAVLIREARADEMDLVRDLFTEYARSLDFDLSFQNFEEELATLPGKYAPPLGGLWLAFRGDEAAGCVALRPFDEGRCEMKRLYVRPQFRGLKIGERLLEHFLKEAREIGSGKNSGGHYQSVVLDTIQPLMSKAIAMYKSVGFREIPPYRPNPIRGAVYMELTLKPPSGRGF